MNRKSAARLQADELAVWSAVKHLSEQALARVGAEIERETGLSGADFGILSRLEDLGGGELAQRDLALSLGWHKSRLSHQLTRMEARELVVRRQADEARGVLVLITVEGRERIAAARPVHAGAVRRHLLDHLDAHERAVIVAVAARLAGEGGGEEA